MIRRLPRSWRRIFHRKGRRGKRLENSIRGLFAARRRRFRQIDLDCSVTADGVAVIEHGPPSGPNVRALTYRQLRRRQRWTRRAVVMFRWARRLGLRVLLEVKNYRQLEDPAYMRRLKADADAARCEVYVGVLQDHGDPLARCRAAHAAGFPVVLLARGSKPARWEQEWAPVVTFVRGRWR